MLDCLEEYLKAVGLAMTLVLTPEVAMVGDLK